MSEICFLSLKNEDNISHFADRGDELKRKDCEIHNTVLGAQKQFLSESHCDQHTCFFNFLVSHISRTRTGPGVLGHCSQEGLLLFQDKQFGFCLL